jgi:hypothetical protein
MHGSRFTSFISPSTVVHGLVRRPGPIRILLALAGLLVLAFVSTDSTSAARYTVAQCGWKVGNDGDWFESSSNRFGRSSWCGVPEGSDPKDGAHMASSTRPSASSVAGERFARWRWSAPSGTEIRSVAGDMWHVLNDGFRHRLGFGTGSGRFDAFVDHTSTDRTRRAFSKAIPSGAEAFESRLLCAKPADRSCSADSTSLAGVRGLTLSLDDPSKPTTTLSGPFETESWVRGVQEVRFSSRDSGSGLSSEETVIDGSRTARTAHDCEASLIAGEWRARKMRPCRLAVSGVHRIDTSRLSDGPHRVVHCSEDFASNRGCAEPVTLNADNTAPSAPRRLTVVGGDGWRNTNSFDLTWETPNQLKAAPVTAYRHRLSGDSGVAGPESEGVGLGAVGGLTLPGPGLFTVSVWLVDAAGNADPANEATVSIGFDDSPPTGFLIDPEPARPDRIRASVSDSLAGIESAGMAVRPRGGGEWDELPTGLDRETGAVTADFGSESRTPGVWEVRLVATDRAGNRLTTQRRGNGSVMVIEAPAKVETRLSAKLATSGRSGSSLRVGPGARTRVEGRLLTGSGRPLAGREVEVIQTPRLGARRPLVRTVTTDRRGRFRSPLASRASRSVSVRFSGTERLLGSSSGPFDLRVRARVLFRARPARLRTGERIAFSGRVLPGRAARMARGSLVKVEYLERSTGKWRPVQVTRVLAGGRFRSGYRFRYLNGTAVIRFRAELMAARGFPYATTASKPVTVRVSG